MNLLVIGNSPKWIRFIESIYRVDFVKVVSWRSLPIESEEIEKITSNDWDLLLIAGYDYKSASYSYENYLNKNVFLIIDFIKKVIKYDNKVIYINTLGTKKNYTFSRYLYAKMLLGMELSKNFKNADILEFPTVVENETICVHGSYFSKIIIKNFVYFKIVKKININNSFQENFEILKKLRSNPKLPKCFFIKKPRPLIIDRFLRIILG